MPIDYSKAKIYKLTTINNPDLVYYGSTINELYKRKNQHKSNFKNHNLKCTSYKLFELGIDDVEITLVESINCNSKEELHQRERFYIENNNCINKFIPNRTQEEYREQNKDKIKEHKKEYYEQNKDIILKKNNQYREQNKDDILNKKKEYYELNKELLKKKNKEYYELNKELLKKKQKEYYDKKKK